MDILKKESQNYDVWLMWQPNFKCNLNCTYCIIKDSRKTAKVSKINISALIKTLNKTNKIFNIDFGGGEPFLIPNLIEACKEITKNHYVSITTNLTSGKIKEFSEKIDPERVEYIYSSLHIKELERFSLHSSAILSTFSYFIFLNSRIASISLLENSGPKYISEMAIYFDFLRIS